MKIVVSGPTRLIVGPAVLAVSLTVHLIAGPPGASQSPRDRGCTEWHHCRELALAAADRGDYEAFWDLAWRAVQTGPPKDPALMYLLARAQALSGRPHDALIMLQRLAEMGVASDGDTNDDFKRTRQLPGWPEVSAQIGRLTHPDPRPAAAAALVSPPAASAVASSSPPAAVPAASSSPSTAAVAGTSLSPSPASALEAVRFSTAGFTLAGLAYDAVSRRFLFGDRLGRKLIIVGEGSHHTVDLVGAASAGFHEISAIEIDAKRGDLWVASTAPAGGAGTLHKLQLVSGRPLRSFPVPGDLEPVTLVDLAVTPAGTVLVLDSAGPQLLVLRPGGTALERVMRIDVREPASLTAADDGLAYVAHREGVSRIDLRARTVVRVAATSPVSLAHLERIRWRRHALIATRVDDDGSRRIMRLDLNASGRAVTQATMLGSSAPAAGQTFVTLSGDDLVYVEDGSSRALDPPLQDPSGMVEFVAYRVRLR
jgi:hypothetical protein